MLKKTADLVAVGTPKYIGRDFSPKYAVPFRLRDVGTLRHARIVEPVKYVELQCYNFKFDKLCDLLSVTCICWFV